MRLLSTAQEEIKSFCAKRGISELLHFVKAAKMPFILRYGLLTNAILRNAGGTIEDNSRIDRNDDHVCLSIDFPNYKLFYKRRMECATEIFYGRDPACSFPPMLQKIMDKMASEDWKESRQFMQQTQGQQKGRHFSKTHYQRNPRQKF